MISIFEGDRRILDISIHQRREQIAKYDEHLRTLKLADADDESRNEKVSLVIARGKLSAEQGFDTASARRQDKARRKSVPMQRGTAKIA